MCQCETISDSHSVAEDLGLVSNVSSTLPHFTKPYLEPTADMYEVIAYLVAARLARGIAVSEAGRTASKHAHSHM